MNSCVQPALTMLLGWRGLVVLALSWRAVAVHADERIWLNAKINGQRAHLAFDTGADESILFPKGAARLGLAVTNAPPGVRLRPGEVTMGRAEECVLELGDSTIRVSFGVIELPAMLALGADGLIGWSQLSRNILDIDAVESKVSPLAVVPEGANEWLKLKLQTNSSRLELVVSKAGGEVSIIDVDTGCANGVKLSPENWSRWKAERTNQPVTLEAYYSPGAGLVVSEEGWSRKLSFGPLELTEVPVMEANTADVALGARGYQATLGLAALKRLEFIVDGVHGIAYVRSRKTAGLSYQHNRLGAVFTPVNLQSEELIARVVDGSPAARAGILSGDILLKIDSVDATRWRTDPSVMPLSRFWERPAGTQLELTLKRGEKVIKVSPKLRQLLAPGN